jgi:hypothetical protein
MKADDVRAALPTVRRAEQEARDRLTQRQYSLDNEAAMRVAFAEQVEPRLREIEAVVLSAGTLSVSSQATPCSRSLRASAPPTASIAFGIVCARARSRMRAEISKSPQATRRALQRESLARLMRRWPSLRGG